MVYTFGTVYIFGVGCHCPCPDRVGGRCILRPAQGSHSFRGSFSCSCSSSTRGRTVRLPSLVKLILCPLTNVERRARLRKARRQTSLSRARRLRGFMAKVQGELTKNTRLKHKTGRVVSKAMSARTKMAYPTICPQHPRRRNCEICGPGTGARARLVCPQCGRHVCRNCWTVRRICWICRWAPRAPTSSSATAAEAAGRAVSGCLSAFRPVEQL